MERLWAPWRSQFMADIARGKTFECIFCSRPDGGDKECFILWRGTHTFMLLNLYPYNPGHLMVAPYRHVTEYGDLTNEEFAEQQDALRRAIAALRSTTKPDGFNIGTNLGKAAGAGFPHLHTHLVPRWSGDANFMATVAEAKLVSESLETTYGKLKEALTKSI
ncbi:MAG: HIT domain-containing protein [Candidatus Aenigmarchaeota archaeon]|nr:HIT domain-containing protein [Candidatus Aenigmarchaeota archaeon]